MVGRGARLGVGYRRTRAKPRSLPGVVVARSLLVFDAFLPQRSTRGPFALRGVWRVVGVRPRLGHAAGAAGARRLVVGTVGNIVVGIGLAGDAVIVDVVDRAVRVPVSVWMVVARCSPRLRSPALPFDPYSVSVEVHFCPVMPLKTISYSVLSGLYVHVSVMPLE